MATRTVSGLEDVRRALQNVPKEARAVLRDVIAVTVRVVAQRTAQNAPFETGALRQAIVGVAPKGSSLSGSVSILPGEFRGRVPSSYVIPLEYGKDGRPFIRPTAEAESGPFVARIAASGKTLERNLEARGGRFT